MSRIGNNQMAIAEPVAIETPRLRIVPFSGEHFNARYVAWLNDPVVVRYSEQRFRTHTIESCWAYWQSFVGTPNLLLAIVARDERFGHIGNLTANIHPVHRVADVGILIGERAVWGNGYGLEAWTAVCDYLLNVIGMRKITAGTLSVNQAMLHLARRAGMVEDGRRLRQSMFEGQAVDVIYTAIFNEKH
jgi:RimJ/RimL family protein N-acetyltransferase